MATKPTIALAQMRRAISQDVHPGAVLADAGDGDETTFRGGLTALGLLYAVGIHPATTVWAPGTAALAPKAWVGRGRRPTKRRREPDHEPVSVKALTMGLAPHAWRSVTWRRWSSAMCPTRARALRILPGIERAPAPGQCPHCGSFTQRLNL